MLEWYLRLHVFRNVRLIMPLSMHIVGETSLSVQACELPCLALASSFVDKISSADVQCFWPHHVWCRTCSIEFQVSPISSSRSFSRSSWRSANADFHSMRRQILCEPSSFIDNFFRKSLRTLPSPLHWCVKLNFYPNDECSYVSISEPSLFKSFLIPGRNWSLETWCDSWRNETLLSRATSSA